MADVLVVEGVEGPALDALESEFAVERAARPQSATRLDDVRALVVRNATRVDGALLAALPSLQVVGRAGAGLDNVDVAAARAAGVTVTYAPAENTAATAEHTLALALAVAHRVCELDRVVRDGAWARRFGTELAGGTWGVVGLGRIGRAVAALARGIGMRTVAFDPAVPDVDARAADVEPVALETVARTAKVISLHVPLVPATRRLVSAELLRSMRPDAILVNTARGGLVDEEALLAALREGRIAGAALDVRDPEPPATPDPLAALDEVVLTPHVAGLSREAQERVTEAVARDVRAVLAGQPPRWPAPAPAEPAG
jgi:D-3-phosphoglycerate dehydrogenase